LGGVPVVKTESSMQTGYHKGVIKKGGEGGWKKKGRGGRCLWGDHWFVFGVLWKCAGGGWGRGYGEKEERTLERKERGK